LSQLILVQTYSKTPIKNLVKRLNSCCYMTLYCTKLVIYLQKNTIIAAIYTNQISNLNANIELFGINS